MVPQRRTTIQAPPTLAAEEHAGSESEDEEMAPPQAETREGEQQTAQPQEINEVSFLRCASYVLKDVDLSSLIQCKTRTVRPMVLSGSEEEEDDSVRMIEEEDGAAPASGGSGLSTLPKPKVSFPHASYLRSTWFPHIYNCTCAGPGPHQGAPSIDPDASKEACGERSPVALTSATRH